MIPINHHNRAELVGKHELYAIINSYRTLLPITAKEMLLLDQLEQSISIMGTINRRCKDCPASEPSLEIPGYFVCKVERPNLLVHPDFGCSKPDSVVQHRYTNSRDVD